MAKDSNSNDHILHHHHTMDNGKTMKKRRPTSQRKKKKKKNDDIIGEDGGSGNLRKKQKRSRGGSNRSNGTSSPLDDFDLNLDTFDDNDNNNNMEEFDLESTEKDDNIVISYEAQAGTKTPIDQYMLQLISLVCNNTNNNKSTRGNNGNNNGNSSSSSSAAAFMALDNPLSPTYTHENEPEKYRLMRLQIRHRFAAASAGGISSIDFAKKLLQLWGGKLVETRNNNQKKNNQVNVSAVVDDDERKNKRKKGSSNNKKINNNINNKQQQVLSNDGDVDGDGDVDVDVDFALDQNSGDIVNKEKVELLASAPLLNSPPNCTPTTMEGEKVMDEEQLQQQGQILQYHEDQHHLHHQKQSVTPSPDMIKTKSMTMLSSSSEKKRKGKHKTTTKTPQQKQQKRGGSGPTVMPAKQKQVAVKETAAMYVNDEDKLIPLDEHAEYNDNTNPGQYYYYFVENDNSNNDGSIVDDDNNDVPGGGISRRVVKSLRMETNDDPENCNQLHCFVRAELLEVCIVTNRDNDIKVIKQNNDNSKMMNDDTTTAAANTVTTPVATATATNNDDALTAAAAEIAFNTTAAAAFTPITPTNDGIGFVGDDNYGDLVAAVTPPAADGVAVAAATTKATTDGCHQYPRIGLRCVYCGKHKSEMSSPSSKGPTGAGAAMSAFFPKSVQDIYRGVCTWQRIHFKNCCHVPVEMKAKYDQLKDADRSRGRKVHWIKSAQQIGLRNVDDRRNGITFRTFMNENEYAYDWDEMNELNEDLNESK